ERAAAAAENDGAQPPRPKIGERVEERGTQRVGEEIERRRVEGERADRAVDRDVDAHARALGGEAGLPETGLFGARGGEPRAPCGPKRYSRCQSSKYSTGLGWRAPSSYGPT